MGNTTKHIACFHLYNDYSGSPKVLKMVLEGLLERGYTIDLHTSRGGVLDEIEHPNLKRHSYNYTFSDNPAVTMARYSMVQLRTAVSALRYLGKDTVFFVNTLLPAGPAMAGRLMGKRVVYHYHENADVKGAFYRILARVMQRLARRIICVSRYQASFLKRQDKVTVIPNALEQSFVAKLRPDTQAAFDRKNVLMISSLKTYKGTDRLVRIAKEMPQYKFTIVINDTQDNIDTYMAEKGLSPLPENLSVYSRQNDVSRFYNQASIVICLTDPELAIETFGLTTLEAMSDGLPVIVPTVGGIAEMVDDDVNGYKIDCHDTDRIKQCISDILSDRDLYFRLSSAAMAKSREYDYSQMTASIADLMQDIRK